MGLHGRAEQEPDARWRFEGPGGTSGGLGSFVLGMVMTAGGGYLILNQVQVTGGYWHWWGWGPTQSTFGLTLIPLVLGIAILFFNARSWAGWLLAGAGTVIIFAGILTSLEIFFRQTSLFNLLLMLVLFVGGLGLMGRSLLRS
jgi:hypothetical protein